MKLLLLMAVPKEAVLQLLSGARTSEAVLGAARCSLGELGRGWQLHPELPSSLVLLCPAPSAMLLPLHLSYSRSLC